MATVFLFEDTQFFDNSGNPLNGGKINTYAAGTVTPLATYTDSTGVTPNANPVVCDSAGRAQLWLTANSYKFVIQTSAGVILATIDGYNPTNVNTTVTALTSTGNVTLQQSTAATSGANQSSNLFKIQGEYWNGSADTTDTWQAQDALGTGTNPTSTLQITHSGSSGTASVSVGSLPLTVGPITTSGQLTSSVATGTAPLSVASTTQVSNLNVSQLEGKTWEVPGTIGSTTPNTAAFTTVNKVTITTPATGSTLTIADGKTATISKTLTLTGTDGTTMTFPGSSDTVVTLAATQALTNKTLGGSGSTTPNTVFNRFVATQGTKVVAGDFSLSAGWGNTASIAGVIGTDSSGQISVTCNGSGIAGNPQITFTFHDGAWPNGAPVGVIGRNDLSGVTGPPGLFLGGGTSTTQAIISFLGTPTAGATYIATWIFVGRPA